MWFQVPDLVVEHPWYAIWGAFTTGGVWTQFVYMVSHMVTKKDMEITTGKIREWANERFVQRTECYEMRTTKRNGGVSPHGCK